MITDDRRKPIIIDEKIEHFAISFTFDYHVAGRNHAIVSLRLGESEQVSEFVKATLNITDNNCAADDA
jgi:hypothetical protein